MNYQDNKRVQTAEELRKMFNLDNLKRDRQAISNNKSGLTRIEAEQESILKSIIINLGDSLENQSDISLWFFDGIPTLETLPVTRWGNLEEHIGDFYYNKQTGYVYKFIITDDMYSWERIEDASLTQAMALTNAELDTTDGSRRVFFATPTTPYDNGDWYIDANGDLYICQISKSSTETYDKNDFIIASKYTDDTKAMEVAGKLTIVSGQVTTIIKNLDLISQTIEDNRYYIDETGNKILITEKMSQVVQTVNKLESELSEAADITISADGYGNVNISNINESEPIYLRIYPTNNHDISFLYPRDNLYPSDDLFLTGRTIRFATSDYTVDYELPDDLLYYDETNYDEFILDYNAQSCLVNKKVNYNADGSKYLLDSPQTLVYEFPTIHLNTGDYTVTILGYEDAYIFVRMMVQNLYTDQFATKMELNSSMTQTAKSINASVDEKMNLVNGNISKLSADLDIQSDKVEAKLDSTDFTSAAIIGLINNRDGTSTAQINASNINLKGYITATDLKTSGSTTINGSNITTGTIDAAKATIKNLNANNITSGTISADKLSGGTIDASKITVKNINGSNITSGTIDASKVTVKNLNANNITSGTISGDRINGGTITGTTIKGNTITGGTLSGTTIDVTAGEIGGFALGEHQFKSNIYVDYDYTADDLTIIRNIIMNEITPTSTQLKKYDINGDGKITSSDYVNVYKIIESNISTTNPGSLEINTNDATKTIVLRDGDGVIRKYLSPGYSYFDCLSVGELTGASYIDGDGISKLSYMDTYMEATTDFGAKGITWWDSDKCLKENIKYSTVNALDIIKQIKHREYDRTDREEHSKLGYIAQELQEIDESLVFDVKQSDGSSILNINQPNLIPYLTKAIQEQQETIDVLKKEIEVLKNEK